MGSRSLSIREGRVCELAATYCWVEFLESKCAACPGVCAKRCATRLAVALDGLTLRLDDRVQVGVPRAALRNAVVALLGVPTLGLLVASVVHAQLSGAASALAIAFSGLATAGVLLGCGAIHVARDARRAAFAPRILVDAGSAVRLSNDSTASRLKLTLSN